MLVAALAVGGAIRVWLSFHDDGIYWPDEIYQSLEPAHRWVFGYGLVAWEFVLGARSWAFPGIVAALLKTASLLGIAEPRGYLLISRLFFSAVSVATAYASYRLARSYSASAFGAAIGASLFCLSAPVIYFAPRAMSEVASALPVALGLSLALLPKARRWDLAAGASLLGIAVLFRLQNGFFCLALVAILAGRRRWLELALAISVLAVWAFLFGLLDKLTWGGWFHSALVYLKANVVEHKAEEWGVSPFSYYARVLWTSMPGPAVAMFALAIPSIRRAPGLALTTCGFFLLHSFVPHKELRFILPALPLLGAMAGIGLSALERRHGPSLSACVGVAALAAAAWSASRFHSLTFGEIGQYEKLKPGASAYDDFGPINRLLLAAHREQDLCGLKIEVVHLAWTGGLTYLHRRVPVYPHVGPPRESEFYNYAIAFAGRSGGEVRASEGNIALVRLPLSSCSPDPGYQWRLP